MPNKPKILAVDDDADIRNVLSMLLSERYTVVAAESGPAAIAAVHEDRNYDLIILDVMMPEMSGYEACEKLRELSNAPILFLTARSAEADRISAYTSGGDDFLSKPFSHQELLAKVSALLRRYTQYRGRPENALEIGGIEIDSAAHKVSRNGEDITLTETEYLILDYLLKHRGVTVSASELYENVWGERFLPGSSNTVMVHVLNLRRKIEEDPANPAIVRTVWGRGYQID